MMLSHQTVYDYCMRKRGAAASFPFHDDIMAIKVMNRYFCLIYTLKGKPCIALKADPETSYAWRAGYPDYITRGYHCPPVQQPYNNTVDLDLPVEAAELYAMIDLSYDYTVSRLTRAARTELALLPDKE